jgi:predicted PhzF superfamily epimerase YddE/YHI9
MTAVDVDVLRVFVDPAGRFGNPLGIVDGYDASVLQVPAGEVSVIRSGEVTSVRAHADWGSTFEWHQLEDPAAVLAVDPASYSADHDYVWAWGDEAAGAVRSRMFAPAMGVVEDEATGSAAVTLTNQLGRDLLITQGAGSQLITTYEGDGWATVGGRVTHETTRTLNLP